MIPTASEENAPGYMGFADSATAQYAFATPNCRYYPAAEMLCGTHGISGCLNVVVMLNSRGIGLSRIMSVDEARIMVEALNRAISNVEAQAAEEATSILERARRAGGAA